MLVLVLVFLHYHLNQILFSFINISFCLVSLLSYWVPEG